MFHCLLVTWTGETVRWGSQHGKDNQISPVFPNHDVEWFTPHRLDVVPYRILVLVSDPVPYMAPLPLGALPSGMSVEQQCPKCRKTHVLTQVAPGTAD